MKSAINKVGLAVLDDNRLLLVRNEGTEALLMPGGKVEDYDPSDEAALAREIREELDCNVEKTTLQFLGVFSDVAANNPGKTVDIKLYAGSLVGEPRISSEIAELVWFDLTSVDFDRLSPIVANKIVPFLRDRDL
ncbi:NUDIX domain-containing protein [Ascidiaceihabitans sp.]|uniref:NUDIX hydrolase n=1 Tax=Ascidiaceihabitans sp. TaxID=1872644 RepID=UPI0032994B6B